ncbi:MAG: GNAT family N-acetyltransferase [Acidobacteriota bacterium]|jgi:RimJ/RimL family protein N-acetyltransferase
MTLEGYPRDLTLKDGTTLGVRPVEADDKDALLAFYRSLPEEDRLFLRDDVTSQLWADRFMASIDYQTVIPLVAVTADRKIVANGTLYRTLHGWTRHVAEVRLAVAREYQRRGLGTAVLRELVRLATSCGVEKIVASVVDNQVGAIRAFEKRGFHREAVLKGHVKDIRGLKRDLVIMSNDVSHIWEAMAAMVADYSPTLGG